MTGDRGPRSGGGRVSRDRARWRRAHRRRYDSTSPTASTVWHGRSSGDDARESTIAYSDVVLARGLRYRACAGPTPRAPWTDSEEDPMGVDTVVAWIGLDWADERHAGASADRRRHGRGIRARADAGGAARVGGAACQRVRRGQDRRRGRATQGRGHSRAIDVRLLRAVSD